MSFQPPLSNITEVQNSIMDELNNLTFVKDNAQKLIERKVSFERRDKKTAVSQRGKKSHFNSLKKKCSNNRKDIQSHIFHYMLQYSSLNLTGLSFSLFYFSLQTVFPQYDQDQLLITVELPCLLYNFDLENA